MDKLSHVGVQTRQTDLAAGDHALAHDAELHHSRGKLSQVGDRSLQRTTGVALARVLEIATAHTELGEGHVAAIGLGAGTPRLQRHIRLEEHVRGGAVLRGTPAGHEECVDLLGLLLQVVADGQANGTDVLWIGGITLAVTRGLSLISYSGR